MVRSAPVLAVLAGTSLAAAPCPIVQRGSPDDGFTTITVVEPAAPVTSDPLFAGWQRARILSAANDNGVVYGIEVRWNRPGVPSVGAFTWMKGGPGTESVRRATAFGASLQDELDRVDRVRSIEITFEGDGLETAPVNGFPNLSAVFADVWEWLAAERIAEGVAGHVGASSSSLLAANALARHGLDRLLDGVVLGGGPFWTDLREACLELDSPIFAGGRARARIDAWHWPGSTPCADLVVHADPPYECRSMLGPGARTDYPELVASVIVGEHDGFDPWLGREARRWWERIGARRKTFDVTNAGHNVLGTPQSADVVLGRIREIVAAAPPGTDVALLEAAPNPVRGGDVRIRFETRVRGSVRLTVYDVRGAVVDELVSGVVGPGVHELTWRGPGRGVGAPAGTYFLRAEMPGVVATRRVTWLR